MKKLLKNDELKLLETPYPGDKKVFEVSPIPVLSLPNGGKYYISRLANYSLASGPSIRIGTVCAVRLDWKDTPYFWNADYYYIYTTGSPTVYELVGPDKQREHRFLVLPEDLVPPGMEEKYYSVGTESK